MSAGPGPLPIPIPQGCGGNASVSSGLSFLAAAALVIGIIAAVATGIGGLAKALFSEFAVKIVGAVAQIFGVTGSVSAGFAAGVLAVAAAAAITAAVIIYWVWNNYSSLSSTPPVGHLACVTGVVNSVNGADLNPFSISHGFILVVVKSCYWPTVEFNNPPFIWCAHCMNCASNLWPPNTPLSEGNIATCSPELPCFYYSHQAVNEALGESIGATVGAAVGAVLGVIAAVAAMAALGCTATGPFAPICWLVVALAVLIAVVVTAAVALVAGLAGAGIGAATTSDSSPSGDPSGSSTATTIAVGAYVSVTGNLLTVANANGSNAIYFAGWIPNAQANTVTDETQTNGNGTTIFGQSAGTPDFCFTDPDSQPLISGLADPCMCQNV